MLTAADHASPSWSQLSVASGAYLQAFLAIQPCRESAWRKTPQGRKARAGYMRKYREALKRRGEAKDYRREPGRKVLLDYKKGE